MLSSKDIINELGKNIFIYPMNNIRIKGASIDLTASKFAWSLKTKKLISHNNSITIPPHDTAIIFTNEVLHVTGKIAGSYHSKVSFVAEGLGHIGTTLDPHYIGLSKLAIHNNSDDSFELKVNHTFVTVMFDYVKTPISSQAQTDSTHFVEAMKDFEGYKDFKDFVDFRDWIFNRDELMKQFKQDEQFKTYKKQRDKTRLYKKNFFVPLVSLVTTVILFITAYLISPTTIQESIPLYAVISICAQLPTLFLSIFKKQ